jgi:enoyl-CoA hydratase/carnithine racemase
MGAEMALDWGLVDALAEDGQTVEKALEMAQVAASMPQLAVTVVKQAVNATCSALNQAASYADADQSQLTAMSQDAARARAAFTGK